MGSNLEAAGADRDADDASSDLHMATPKDADDRVIAPCLLSRDSLTNSVVYLPPSESPHMASKKRKSSDALLPAEPSGPGRFKRAKLGIISSPRREGISSGGDRSLLPPEIWHRIFTFCPPKTLGNLLRVNKLFNFYLDPSAQVPLAQPPSSAGGALSPVKPDNIWRASRRFFWPHMPVPLRSMTELQSWRLVCSNRCQVCGKQGSRDAQAQTESLKLGPGTDDVAPVWPFALCVCGSCLLKRTIKEIDLLLSPTFPSTLVPSLVFVFLTQDFHVLSPSVLAQTQLPADMRLTKLFLASDVEDLKEEFDSVKGLGPGTTEEWLKGLDDRAKQSKTEALKWEKWAQSGSHHRVLAVTDPFSPQITSASFEHVSIAAQNKSTTSSGPPLNAAAEGYWPRNAGSSVSGHQAISAAGNEAYSATAAAERQAARRTEIERRAALFDPAILPDILQRLPPFQAAAQLPTPLDNKAWELLEPHLLADRVLLDDGAKTKAAHPQSIASSQEQRALVTAPPTSKAGRELAKKYREDVQASVRARIAPLADEAIKEWGKRGKTTIEDISLFAASVLEFVRKKFYDEVAKEVAGSRPKNQDSASCAEAPDEPSTKKLTLEDMKWIFDMKIKPLIDCEQRDLFYCSRCEGTTKTYGFEAVIQHYAAKHTNALSRGNVVVHWRAEWPEELPFTAQPRRARNMRQRAPNTSLPPAYGFGSHPRSSEPIPQLQNLPCVTDEVPAYATPLYCEPYLPQPQQLSSLPSYPPSTGYVPAQQFPNPEVGGLYPNHLPPPPPPPEHNSTYPYGPASVITNAPPASAILPAPGLQKSVPVDYTFPYVMFPAGEQVDHYRIKPHMAAVSEQYHVQLEALARDAREIWDAIGNIKDLPGVVRLFTTIHHLVKRFRTKFAESPSLDMFEDGISNRKEMRPVRHIYGISCKACRLGLESRAAIFPERERLSLPQLIKHFKKEHVEPVRLKTPRPPLDWSTDMVLLPPPPLLAKLPTTIGSDRKRISLFSDAFPEIFESARSTTAGRLAQSTTGSFPSDDKSLDGQNRVFNVRHSKDKTQDYFHGSAPSGTRPQLADNNDFSPREHKSGWPGPRKGKQGKDQGPSSISVPNSAAGKKKKPASQAPPPGQGPNRKKKAKKKGERGTNLGTEGQGTHGEAMAKMEENAEQLRDEEIRTIRAADRVRTTRLDKSSTKLERDISPIQLSTRPPTAEGRIIVTRSMSAGKADRGFPSKDSVGSDQGPSLMTALEMHLDHRRSPVATDRWTEQPNQVLHMDSNQVPPRAEHRHTANQDRYSAQMEYPSYPSRPVRSQSPLSAQYNTRAQPEVRLSETRVQGRPDPDYHQMSTSQNTEVSQYRRVSRHFNSNPDERVVYRCVKTSDADWEHQRSHWRNEIKHEGMPPPATQLNYHTGCVDSETLYPTTVRGRQYERVRVEDSHDEYYIRRPIEDQGYLVVEVPRHGYHGQTFAGERYNEGDGHHLVPGRWERDAYAYGTSSSYYVDRPPTPRTQSTAPPPPHTASYNANRPQVHPPSDVSVPEPFDDPRDEEYDPRFPAAAPSAKRWWDQ
ncbi:hypothetical protein VTK73DRAFT_7628 [Phialemonium thermophilum]|uniref:DUF7892 domain-containing protein n=1 Tax=Phialemonium thermophilum TaxID=223376 RepID=A0ABR3Y6C0_9PEZI